MKGKTNFLFTKIVAILMALIILFVCPLATNAAVGYDTERISDKANYKTLTVSGTNYYNYAFECLDKINSLRESYRAIKMDADMMEAAMLRAHELSEIYNADVRPNGENNFDYVDSIVIYNLFVNKTEYKSDKNISDSVSDTVEKILALLEKDLEKNAFDTSKLRSAGIGCFKPDGKKEVIWTVYLSFRTTKNEKTLADLSSVTESKTEKIALCNDNYKLWEKSHSHLYETSVTPANASKKTSGKIYKKCKICGDVVSTVIKYPNTFTLSATSYTYDGKVKKPSVTVKDSAGKTISASNYTVTYASGRKDVGKYAVKITFNGNFTGTVTKYFNINPKNTSISSVTAGSKKFTVKLKKYTTQTTGYQIQYATNSKFTGAKTVSMKNTTVSKTVSKLKGNQKYYVRVRTYKTVGSAKYYSAWSKAKAVTTKK